MTLETNCSRARRGILTGLCLVLAGNSIEGYSYAAEQSTPSIERRAERDYSIGDFKKAYGKNAWNALDEARKKATEKQFERLPVEMKREAFEVYDNTLKYVETHLSKEQKKEFDNLGSAVEYSLRLNEGGSKKISLFRKGVDIDKLRQEYAKKAPWVNLDEPSYDLGFIYLNECGKGRLNPDLLKRKYCLPY